MNIKHILIITASVTTVAAASAQELKTEIVVDRIVQPELREATRLSGVTPSLVSPAVTAKHLTQAEYTGTGSVTSEIGLLPPASWMDSVPLTPYRGYASIGYLPAFNLGANAGYRLLDTDKLKGGVWMQYDGNSYKSTEYNLLNIDGVPKRTHSSNYITIGGDIAAQLAAQSVLSLKLDYTYASVKRNHDIGTLVAGDPSYFTYDLCTYNQGASEFNSLLDWRSRTGQLQMRGGISFGHFRFTDSCPDSYPFILSREPVRQNLVGLAYSMGWIDGDDKDPWLVADIDWTFMHTNELPCVFEGTTFWRTTTLSLGHFNPYIVFGDPEFISGRVGLMLSLSHGNDNGKVSIAPDVQINWRMIPAVSVYAKAGGGQHLNPMKTLFGLNPYVMTTEALFRSNNSLQLEGGLVIGPTKGFNLKFCGGYDIVKGRVSPVIVLGNEIPYRSAFYSHNVNSWFVNLRAGYDFGKTARLEAGVQRGGSNNKIDSALGWYDGAKFVVDGTLKLTPIDPLDICVGYQLRTDRKMCFGIDDEFIGSNVSLDDISSLNLSAAYRVNDQLSVFGIVDNLLNHRYKLISGIEAQGIKGLVGVAYKF